MPIALIFVGAILAIAGIKNNAATLGATVKEDFSGAGSFWYWVFAVIIVGAVGYNSKAETVSRLFLGLVVLVFVLSNGGVYARVVEALQNPQPAPADDGAGASDEAGAREQAGSMIDQLDDYLPQTLFGELPGILKGFGL